MYIPWRQLLDYLAGKNERGAAIVEYALLVVLIALAAFLAVALAGRQLSTTYSSIADSLVKANGG